MQPNKETRMPDISASVIIPTYNRPDQLEDVLESLARQTFPPQCTEIIVIDDGSSQSYDQVTGRNWPYQLQYRKQENLGEIAARSLGVSCARSGFLIFLDDDIYVEPEYIAELVREHERYPQAILLGVLYPWLGAHPTPFQVIQAAQTEPVHPGEVSYIECGSGTMSVGKDVYTTAGGMRTLGPGGRNAWGGMDFAYRAHLAGFKARRCTAARAYHDDFAMQDLETMSKRYFKVSRMAVLHLQRFPELLPQISMFQDKTPVEWGKDRPRIIVRKLARKAMSSMLVIRIMERLVRLLEKHYPARKLLAPLYRWILGGYIFRGYRQGLHDFGLVQP
jgi:glycosyltransferase involved in cell wall biosynthesis